MMSGLSDQEFHSWLSALEQGEELPASLPLDDVADLALARRLLAMRAESTPRLRARVRQTTSAAAASRRPGGLRGVRWAIAGMMATLVLASALALTPVGSWAQGVLQRFGVIFVLGVIPQWSAGLPEIIPTSSPVVFRSEREVKEAAKFPLRWPSDFPFDRDSVAFLGYMVDTQNGAWIESLYGDADHRLLEIQVFWRQRPGPWPVGDARFKPIRVSGYDGLWGEGVPPSFIAGARSSLTVKAVDGTETRIGGSQVPSLAPINVLLWEEGETLYMLVDPNQRFSQTELLRMAVSSYQND